MKNKYNIKLLYDENRLFLQGKQAYPVNKREMEHNITRQVGIFKNIWSLGLILLICAGAVFIELLMLTNLVDYFFSYESSSVWYTQFSFTLLGFTMGLGFGYILLDTCWEFTKWVINYKLIDGSVDYLLKNIIECGEMESALIINKTDNGIVLEKKNNTIVNYATKQTNAVQEGDHVYIKRLFIAFVVL